MKTCDDVRAWLLESEPHEIRASRGPAAEHMGECAECRALAERLVRADVALSSELERLTPRLSATAAVDLARGRSTAPTRARAWRRAGIRLAPLAAAAALLLLLRGPGEPAPGRPFIDSVGPEPAPDGPYSLSVQATGESGLAVFATPNPKIHVVWLY